MVPVTAGVAMDVPPLDPYASKGTVDSTSLPLTTISGFSRPSFAGPLELNQAKASSFSTAPTVRAFFAAGYPSAIF